MTTKECKNQIEWFTDLLASLDDKDYESVRAAIIAAIALLTRASEAVEEKR